ncbi:hypothetical protein ABL78_8319 [Leptomonas seymouri]|uniref:Uncharacterized protein n=1 Tax=Leptomonas seymouri TaxID=5684 RepID=A0A0N1IG49_LEPSE|nr:hypothetical protein ABL78_8319 [Leptomonas seymouri]|eukprot:KPI82668.1 hypothetical protein ABL78_8319 [Leptomonas seymouri]
MQAYIDSICKRSPPRTAVAVQHTKSALLLQSHQLERKRRLDEEAARERTLQTGRGNLLWGLRFHKQRNGSSRNVRHAGVLNQHTPSPFEPPSSLTSGNPSAHEPATPLRPSLRSKSKRTLRQLGLPPTSPSPRPQQNKARAWTPLSFSDRTAQLTPGRNPQRRQQRTALLPSTRDSFNDSPSPTTSPWHSLFSNSPSPSASSMSRWPVHHRREEEDEGDGTAAAGGAASPARIAAPCYSRLNTAGARQWGLSMERKPHAVKSPMARIPSTELSDAQMHLKRDVQFPSSAHPPPSYAPPPAVWTSWEPHRGHQQLSTVQHSFELEKRRPRSASRSPTAEALNGTVASISRPSVLQSSPPRTRENTADPIPKPLPPAASQRASAFPSAIRALRDPNAHGQCHDAPYRTSHLKGVLRGDSPPGTPPHNPASASHACFGPSHSRREPSAHRRRRLPADGAPSSLRDLHERLFLRLQTRSRAATASAATHLRARSDGSMVMVDAVSGATAAVKLWRSTRDLYESLAEERDLMHTRLAREDEDTEAFCGAARGARKSSRVVNELHRGQQRGAMDRAAVSTRDYLYMREAEEGAQGPSQPDRADQGSSFIGAPLPFREALPLD